jgi:hypothetical protein
MYERSEFRSRREKRTENGVKNPIGSELFPKTFLIMESEMRFFIHFGKAYSQQSFPFA